MKKLRLVLAATALLPMFITVAKAEKREGLVVSRASGINFQQVVDVSPWDRFSAQAVYSDGTPSSHTVIEGTRASATITVGPSPSALIGAQASSTINVRSTVSISGQFVKLNGVVFTAGTNFSIGTTTSATATNLKAAIDAHPDWDASVTGATVTVKYATYGTVGNGLVISTSSSVNFGLASGGILSGGVNRHTLTINGVTLTEGINFNANSSSSTMAINISTNINANTSLNATVTASTTSLGVVTVKAIAIGPAPYSIQTSTPGGLIIGTGFPGGASGYIDVVGDSITLPSPHNFTTGLKVLVSTTGSNSMPSGLISGTTYFAIKLNDYQYKLATSSTNAVAGTAVDITDISNGSTFGATPPALSLAANNGFYWEVSNDSTTWTTLTGVTVNGVSVSSVTYSAAGGTTWDFGTLNYHWMRVNYTGPTNGAISLNVRIFGKKD